MQQPFELATALASLDRSSSSSSLLLLVLFPQDGSTTHGPRRDPDDGDGGRDDASRRTACVTRGGALVALEHNSGLTHNSPSLCEQKQRLPYLKALWSTPNRPLQSSLPPLPPPPVPAAEQLPSFSTPSRSTAATCRSSPSGPGQKRGRPKRGNIGRKG